VNLKRSSNGLPPLAYDATLTSFARSHSEDMGLNNYFDFIDLNGLGPNERAAQQGYYCRRGFEQSDTWDYSNPSYITKTHRESSWVGLNENILKIDLKNRCGQTEDEIALLCADEWMKKSDKNILCDYCTYEGIGIANKDNILYITQDIC
jgi:hypothetical protein